MIRVLIAGEGPNEIGNSALRDRTDARTTGAGVIEAFLEKVRPGGWEVRDARRWKDIHKLKPNAPGDGEAKTLRGLELRARELGCNALVFLRDRDRQQSRERAIRDTLREREPRADLRIAGGVPIEKLECWLLALRGEKDAHTEPDPEGAPHGRHGIPPKKTTAMVELVRNARLMDATRDAVSLWRWLRRVAMALHVEPIPKQWPRP